MTDGLSPAIYAPGAQDHPRWSSPRMAGRALSAALVTLILATTAIALYFGGAGDVWGPVNDILVAATVLLLLPTIVAVRQLSRQRTGAWLTVLTVAACGGVFIMAVGQLALVAGLIDLETSFVTGSIGVLMVIAWMAGTAVLALDARTLSRSVGWWAVAFVVAVMITAVAIPSLGADTPTLSTLFGGPLLVTLAGWMLSLARDLGRRGA
jgi:hypothetical protein